MFLPQIDYLARWSCFCLFFLSAQEPIMWSKLERNQEIKIDSDHFRFYIHVTIPKMIVKVKTFLVCSSKCWTFALIVVSIFVTRVKFGTTCAKFKLSKTIGFFFRIRCWISKNIESSASVIAWSYGPGQLRTVRSI